MPEPLSNDVFISYRRDVSQYMAMALWQNLTDRGIDVFYDLEIHAGQFESIILAQIGARPYMVPVLQTGALNECVERDDLFRREIEAALATDRMLVPVYAPEFDFDDIERYLPETTAKALRGFNMLEIPTKYFKYAINELAENYLTPIRRDLTPVTPVAATAADQQADATMKAPAVTTETLTAEEHFARAYDAAERGNHQEAIDGYTEAIRLKADYADAFNNRGHARSNLGDHEGAIQDLDEAIRLDPKHIYALSNRGFARSELGDLEGAIQDLDEAIRLDPGDAELWNQRGATRSELADYEGAIADLDEAIRLNPDYSAAFNNRGHQRNALGDQERAIADYDEAIRLDPSCADAKRSRELAVAALKMQR